VISSRRCNSYLSYLLVAAAVTDFLQLRYYVRLLLGGRQPLCGIGVTSRMLVTNNPAPCNALMAASLPAPGPLTNTLIFCMPWSMPFRAAPSAARCAAKAVPFLDPLKPAVPALPQATTLPVVSVKVTMVLLKVD
jgi:hypothetical protein